MKKVQIIQKKKVYYMLLPKDALTIVFFNDFLELIHSTGAYLQQRFISDKKIFDILPPHTYCVQLVGEQGQKLDRTMYDMAETFVNSRVDEALENSFFNTIMRMHPAQQEGGPDPEPDSLHLAPDPG